MSFNVVCKGAQWDSEIQLLLAEKERKRSRAMAHEEKKKTASSVGSRRPSRINNAEAKNRNEDCGSRNSTSLAPYATTTRKRPKSAGHTTSRSRVHENDQLKSSVCKQDPLGGYLVGPEDTEEFGSAYPAAPPSPTQDHVGAGRYGRPIKPSRTASGLARAPARNASGGTINSRFGENNFNDKVPDNTRAKTDLNIHRPKSAGPLGASRRRQAARGLNRSDTDTSTAAHHMQNAQSESLWTATANKNATVEFSEQDMSMIEEELYRVDDNDNIPQQQNDNFDHRKVECDSDDDLEVAMAKWMKKQEDKSFHSGARGSHKSVAASTFQGVVHNDGFSDVMEESFQSSAGYSISRFEFDERVRDRKEGPFEGAGAIIRAVGNGVSSQTAPGVKVPVASHTRHQFRSINALEKERTQRQFEKYNGYTHNYLVAAEAEEDRSRRAISDTIPADTYRTYAYDDRRALDKNVESLGSDGFGYRKSVYYEERGHQVNSIVPHQDGPIGGGDTIVALADSDRKSRPPPPPPEKRLRESSHNASQSTTNSSIFYPQSAFRSELPDVVSDDPLQTSVEKFRSAYSGLTWDF